MLIAAGCSQPSASSPTTAAPSAEAKMGDMDMTGPIRSTGVVTQIDADAGTVTFDHQAIAAIGWPAMTMQFHAEDPAVLQGIAVGDHVSFQLKSASEPAIVTVVQKQ
ncbi:MAG: copper-binding protein [Proteobacteria bacterium]|nr:copper-binding protein [Pseudomonadota bacterium]